MVILHLIGDLHHTTYKRDLYEPMSIEMLILSHFVFARFVTAEEKKQSGIRRENEVLIQRRKEGTVNGVSAIVTVPYRVLDSTQRLQQTDW